MKALIALLALPAETPPELEAIAQSIALFFTDSSREIDPNGAALRLRIEDQHIHIAREAHPIPWSVLEQPCRAAWYWPDAAEELGRHRSHIAVALPGPGQGSPVTRSLLLTRLVALLGESFQYLGVHWDAAPMVHAAKDFSDSAREMGSQNLPLRLWAEFRTFTHKDGTHSLNTRGLEALGLREIEARRARQRPEEINGWAYNIAHYQLAEKVQLQHGQAVGKNAHDWVRVYQLRSAVDPERTVLYLDFDEGLSE